MRTWTAALLSAAFIASLSTAAIACPFMGAEKPKGDQQETVGS